MWRGSLSASGSVHDKPNAASRNGTASPGENVSIASPPSRHVFLPRSKSAAVQSAVIGDDFASDAVVTVILVLDPHAAGNVTVVRIFDEGLDLVRGGIEH